MRGSNGLPLTSIAFTPSLASKRFETAQRLFETAAQRVAARLSIRARVRDCRARARSARAACDAARRRANRCRAACASCSYRSRPRPARTCCSFRRRERWPQQVAPRAESCCGACSSMTASPASVLENRLIVKHRSACARQTVYLRFFELGVDDVFARRRLRRSRRCRSPIRRRLPRRQPRLAARPLCRAARPSCSSPVAAFRSRA